MLVIIIIDLIKHRDFMLLIIELGMFATTIMFTVYMGFVPPYRIEMAWGPFVSGVFLLALIKIINLDKKTLTNIAYMLLVAAIAGQCVSLNISKNREENNKMKKLFVVLPCYNEEKDIEKLVDKWINLYDTYLQKGYDMTVYCVNDCSTDNTKDVINSLCSKYGEKVKLIDHEINKGLGGVLNTGFNMFNDCGNEGDICVLMDGDDTHDPVYSLPMLEKINTYDCIIASRYCSESKVKGVPKLRLFTSWGAKLYYTLMLNVKGVKDYTCGYRMYTYDIINKALNIYGDKFIEKRSFACMMEALYKLSKCGASFAEVPFELRYDQKIGESKMKIFKTIKDSLLTAFMLRIGK